MYFVISAFPPFWWPSNFTRKHSFWNIVWLVLQNIMQNCTENCEVPNYISNWTLYVISALVQCKRFNYLIPRHRQFNVLYIEIWVLRIWKSTRSTITTNQKILSVQVDNYCCKLNSGRERQGTLGVLWKLVLWIPAVLWREYWICLREEKAM